MKFWKILSSLTEEMLPDWQDKFLSYKALKKQLKLIYPKQALTDDDDNNSYSAYSDDCVRPSKRLRLQVYEDKRSDYEVSKEVTDFVTLLEEEIDKFNAFFVDKEEEYIIRLKVLQDRLEEADGLNGDLINVGRQIVDFHGEMVLLENYSALNYTGLVKILKKYDKRSGALIRLPFIQKVLEQPFFRIDVLNQLVKKCERMLDYVFSVSEISSQSEAMEGSETITETETEERSLEVPQELAEIEYMENMYVKLASSALRVLKEIRSGSSTVNMFSLPPL